MRYLSKAPLAEEAVLDGFLKIFKSIKHYDASIAELKTWMSRIFINTCLDQLKIKSKIFNQSFLNLDEIREPEISLQDYSIRDLLNQMSDMPKGYLVVFNLYAVEGYDHNEIASILDIKASTSRSQYYRAKQWLQVNINKYELIS